MNIVIGLAVVALILARQLRVRPVREDARVAVLLVLGVLGVVSMSRTLRGHHVPTSAVAVLVASFVLAAVLGGIRALTVRVWRESDGRAMRQGTTVTAILWIVSVAAHLGAELWLDKLSDVAGLGASSILAYLAITWAVQTAMIRGRALHLAM